MFKLKIISLVLTCALGLGCTTAGPFVTSISNAGDGRIVVEKCMAKFNMWTGTLSNDDCNSTMIRVEQARARRR